MAIARDNPDDAAPQPGEQAPDPAAVDADGYASRYQLPQLAAHQQAEQSNLEGARSQASAKSVTPPPARPLPPGIYYDSPETQQWRSSVGDPGAYTSAAADNPGVELLDPRLFDSAPRQSFAIGTVSGERALGRPKPPAWRESRQRPSDDDDED